VNTFRGCAVRLHEFETLGISHMSVRCGRTHDNPSMAHTEGE
jgi:hypothetical protein